mmetsp:Transcript_28515/g.94712  ORF Transcript_28515/g.94712 Transcript_28515/m.94712 type:complete len:217 (-) Transcript_28515:188-838(-)
MRTRAPRRRCAPRSCTRTAATRRRGWRSASSASPSRLGWALPRATLAPSRCCIASPRSCMRRAATCAAPRRHSTPAPPRRREARRCSSSSPSRAAGCAARSGCSCTTRTPLSPFPPAAPLSSRSRWRGRPTRRPPPQRGIGPSRLATSTLASAGRRQQASPPSRTRHRGTRRRPGPSREASSCQRGASRACSSSPSRTAFRTFGPRRSATGSGRRR